MNQTHITLVGNVVTDVATTTTPGGVETASFRMATTPRRYDRGIGAWVDGDTSYVRVTAWRRLARHVAESLAKGDPVVVHGTMRVREWDGADGQRRTSVDVEAASIGHDLARGTSVFHRAARRDAAVDAGTANAQVAPLPAA